MQIKNGTLFDTPFEIGCKALEEPDESGNFLAIDSDGVTSSFHTAMVIGGLAGTRSVGARPRRDRDQAIARS